MEKGDLIGVNYDSLGGRKSTQRETSGDEGSGLYLWQTFQKVMF
jgi:hypothetical protein